MNLSIHDDYKLLHEKYMENHNGTTLGENIFMICLPLFLMINTILANFCIYSIAFGNVKVVYKETGISHVAIFFLEFVVFIFPIIIFYTILSNDPFIYFIVFLMPSVFVGCFAIWKNFKIIGNIHNLLALTTSHKPRPFITYFRSLVNLVTAICILAVDFKMFPRRFAKTESFGFGLMDTGVGLFVVCNAVVVSSRSTENGKTSIKHFLHACYIVFKKNVPLLLIGTIRFITTNQINYHTHVTEYGVHWNFFFTLGFVNIICSILITFVRDDYVIVLTVCTLFLHEGLLQCGLQAWAMNISERNSILASNKEGVSSLLGYVSLYFIGLLIGQHFTAKNNTIASDIKMVCKLSIYAKLMLIFTFLLDKVCPVSRKLANMCYCSWITGLSLTILAFSLLVEILFSLSFKLNKANNCDVFIPLIIKAINYNGLAFFIFANMLTGIINLSFYTLHLSNVLSVCILSIYMCMACGCITVMYLKQIKIKF